MSLMTSLGAPFRINAPVRTASTAPAGPVIMESATVGGQPPPPPPQPGDAYLTRLVKLVPSEVVTLYLAFKEVAASWIGIWAAICLGLVIFVRTFGTMKNGKKIQWLGVGIATISYVLWIYAMGGHILDYKLPPDVPGIVSVAIGVWTFLVPYFYSGD